jgi:hypothetical protein
MNVTFASNARAGGWAPARGGATRRRAARPAAAAAAAPAAAFLKPLTDGLKLLGSFGAT